MSSRVTAGGSTLGEQAQVPVIRPFQVDSGGLGQIASTVNLFRGDVTLPVTLVSLPGRGGLSASATLLYSSNVRRDVERWNLTNPSGPIALGWSFGYEFIGLDNANSAAPSDDAYYLIAGGGSNRLYVTARTSDYWELELDSYSFWDIRYYPNDEKWVIVKEDGRRWIYGGRSSDPITGAVQYGVKWGGPEGNWTEPSAAVGAQQQFALAWNLSEVITPWADRLVFEYENDMPQVGGASGQRYTRASRLKRVIDPSGQTIDLVYKEKIYDADIHEYQIPHIDPAAPALVAYQDRYETRYLASLEVREAADGSGSAGALLSRVDLDYEIINASGELSDPDLYKRYLTRTILRTSDGLALPPMTFSYYNRPEDIAAGNATGALREILYPQGGTVTYEFARTALRGTSHTLDLQTAGNPRVFHGPDYTVVTRLAGPSQLDVRIYSWVGVWVESPSSQLLPVDVDLETIDIQTQTDFFALHFRTAAAQPSFHVILFHRHPGRFGHWTTETGFTNLPIGPGGEQALIATGNSYAVAFTSSGALMAKVWDPPTRAWVNRLNSISLFPNAQYAMGAFGNDFVIASWDSSGQASLQLYYLDATERDFHPGSLQTSTLSGVVWDDTTPDNFWSVAAGFASMTYITNVDDDFITYEVAALQWNDRHQGQIAFSDSYVIDRDTKLPFAQSPASGSVIGNLLHLYRFNGLQWVRGQLDLSGTPENDANFTYGSDAAIIVNGSTASVSVFNPYTSTWIQNAAQTQAGSDSPMPTISGDFFTAGNAIYYRDTFGQLQLLGSIPSPLVSASLANRAPLFVVYENTAGTHLLRIRNGNVLFDTPIDLPNQKLAAGVSGPGTTLVGPSSMVTYTGASLDQAATITLRQFVDEAVEGPVVIYPVTQLSINDGYDDSWTSTGADDTKKTLYRYDCENVTLTPDAAVAEFAAATTIYGAPETRAEEACYPPPADTPYGTTEFRYHNNRAPLPNGFVLSTEALDMESENYSFLVGQVFDQTDRDADGVAVVRRLNRYEIRRERELLDGSGRSVRLYGQYVKLVGVEDTFYEEILVGEADTEALDRGELPEEVRDLYARYGIESNGVVVRRRAERLWSYFPRRASHIEYPITMRASAVGASVAVIRRVEYEYSWATGMQKLDRTTNTDSLGRDVTLSTLQSYAWEVPAYAGMKDSHMLSDVTVTINLVGDAATSIALTTYKKWFDDPDRAQWAVCRVFAATTADDYDPGATPPVDFDGWANGSLPPDDRWRCLSEVTARLATGPVLEALDTDRRPTTTIFDVSGSFRYAEITNVTRSEWTYAGFESYERLDGWSLAGGGSIASHTKNGDAHTGVVSLQLLPDPNEALQKTVTLRDPGKRYILSCWVKTGSAFGSATGEAAWAIRVGQQDVLTFPIPPTDATWRLFLQPVSIADRSGPLDVVLRAYNHKNGSDAGLLIDDIFFAPLLSEPQAWVYHPGVLDLSATVAFNGVTTRSLLDSYRRPAVDVGAIDSVTLVAATYNTLQFHEPAAGTAFVYPKNEPDSALAALPTQPSPYANFVQGDQWTREWTSSALSKWKVENATLIHTTESASADAITWSATNGFFDYGVRVSVALPPGADGLSLLPTQPLGIRLGDRFAAEWRPAGGWHVTLDGATTSHSTGTSAFQTDWLLAVPADPVSGVTWVLFYVNGLLLFSKSLAAPIAGAVSLFAQSAGVGFHGIASFRAPRLSSIYSDGTKKERQRQALAGNQLAVTGTGYDPVGRAAIPTKAIRLADRPFGYVLDLVTAFDPVTGVMAGRAADAYPGDEGYPYVRTEFHRSPANLVAAQGLPGRPFAIIREIGDGGAEVDANTHVTRYAYGTNEQGGFWGAQWPSGQYFVQKMTDPDGGESWSLRTKTDQLVATKEGPLSDGTYRTTVTEYDAAGLPVRVFMPNHFAAGAAADSFVITMEHDYLGQLIRRTTPDAVSGDRVYDRSGRIRFTAGGATPNVVTTIVYTKYDDLGRVVEEGFFTAAWDRPLLSQKAIDDPSYPGAAQSPTVTGAGVYDGDGSVPTLIGRLLSATTRHADGSGQVVETFTYDVLGNRLTVAQTAVAFDEGARVVGFDYNSAGDTTRIVYPPGSAVSAVVQSFDRFGALWRVGTDTDARDFGNYEYNPVGALTRATLDPSSQRPITRAFQYNSPGWLASIESRATDGTTLFDQTLTYTEGGYDGAAYYGGAIASSKYESVGGNAYTYRYRFDDLRQLDVAENTADAAASLGVGEPLHYDPNANILTLEQGTETRSYQYTNGTDRAASVTSGGTTIEALSYAPAGGVESSQRLEIANIDYDVVSGLTSRIEGSAFGSLAFSYGNDGTRTVKVQTEGGAEVAAKLYVRAGQALPLAETVRTSGGQRNAQYIYGAEGLQTLLTGGHRYTVLRDNLGSPRVVVDENGSIVASFSYSPFGGIIRRAGSDPDILLYRYTGQELDPETGLYNDQARFYDPWLARFIAIDPKPGPTSPYAYVGNDPVDLNDPLGEEPLTVFLVILAIGLILGATAGAMTYALTYQGNFDIGKFFLYTAVGAVSGAAAGAASYAAGALAITALAAAGVATSTSIASGIIVGAVTGAVEGVVAGSMTQIGTNLIEANQPFAGVGRAAWMGAASGAASGAAFGGLTGALNRRVALRLANPDVGSGPTTAGGFHMNYNVGRNAGFQSHATFDQAVANTNAGKVVTLQAHGARGSNSFYDDAGQQFAGAAADADSLVNSAVGGFRGYGVDLSGVCHAGRNGIARKIANGWKVPVRAGNWSTWTVVPPGANFARNADKGTTFAHRTGRYETIYPSRIKTGWVGIFGY